MQAEGVSPKQALQGAEGKKVRLVLQEGFLLGGKPETEGKVRFVGKTYAVIHHDGCTEGVNFSDIKQVVLRS